MTSELRNNLLGALALFTVLAFVPALIGERYLLNEMVILLLWASVAVQWNVLTGHAGVFSLGQMLLFAIGAYTVAMTSTYLGLSPWIAMPVGGLLAAVAALLIGLACLRLAAAYVALLTFAMSYMVYVLIITETNCFTTFGGGCQRFFGGTSGFSRIEDLGFRQLLKRDWIVGNYFTVLGVFAMSFVASIIVIHGRLGLAFRAIADSPVYAAARGLNRTRFRLIAFVVTAFFTGLTGAAYGAHFRTAGPSLFDFSTLLFILSMMIVGGLRSTWGPVAGAAIMMGIVEIAKDVSDIRNTLIGLVIVVFVVSMPDGIAGFVRKFFNALARPKAKETN